MRRLRINGRRGVFLAIFGVIYVAIGLSYVFPASDSPVRHSMAWMPWWSPLWLCGALWLGAGFVAGVAAFQPLPRDRFGFEALSGVATGWTIAYVISWGVGDAPRGWVSAMLFALVGAAVLTVSGMLNPPQLRSVK